MPRAWFPCFACGHELSRPTAPAGARVTCPECGVRQLVPAARPIAAPAPTRAATRGERTRLKVAGASLGAVVVLALVVPYGRQGPDSRPVPRSLAVASIRPPEGVSPEPGPPAIPNEAAPDPAPPPVPIPAPVESPGPAGDPDLLAFRQPRTIEEIRAGLAALSGEGASRDGGATAEQSAALRRLQAYRFLCGVPYLDLALDESYSRRAEAAADICQRLGGLTHTPENPGLPEERYQVAREAAGRCNLAFGTRSLVEAVDLWMDDSDASNIDRLGHRRWCLNPEMARTGMGRVRDYTAMYVSDRGRAPGAEIEAVLFPPPGYVPVEFFGPGRAWSLSLNPRVYRVPVLDRLDVRVCRVEGREIDRGHSLEIEALGVETRGFGVPLCVIFRPRGLEVRPGRAYWAEIAGLETTDGAATAIKYRVEFIP